MNNEVEQYGYLWHGKNEGWVLLSAPDLPGGYCVFNKVNNTILCIESDEMNEAVCDRMHQLGFEVLESIATLVNDVRVAREE